MAAICFVSITKNESHNIEACFDSFSSVSKNWLIVDSFSNDRTLDVAVELGATVLQRKFDGFGSQWNFAMKAAEKEFSHCRFFFKIDPDERLDQQLRDDIVRVSRNKDFNVFKVNRELYFLGKPVGLFDCPARGWFAGTACFTNSKVNEHLVGLNAKLSVLKGTLKHLDSVDSKSWLQKQDFYCEQEAKQWLLKSESSEMTNKQRWLRRFVFKSYVPSLFVFFYYFLGRGLWKSGSVGLVYSFLRSFVFVWRRVKYQELMSPKERMKL